MGNSSSATVPRGPPPRFVLTTPSLARYEGVLLGMAIGDFVGAFVEGNSPAESAAAVDRIARCVREQVRTFSDSQSVVRKDVLWGRIQAPCSSRGPSLHASSFFSAPLIIYYFLFVQMLPAFTSPERAPAPSSPRPRTSTARVGLCDSRRSATRVRCVRRPLSFRPDHRRHAARTRSRTCRCYVSVCSWGRARD
jgi:hypothetical protein